MAEGRGQTMEGRGWKVEGKENNAQSKSPDGKRWQQKKQRAAEGRTEKQHYNSTPQKELAMIKRIS